MGKSGWFPVKIFPTTNPLIHIIAAKNDGASLTTPRGGQALASRRAGTCGSGENLPAGFQGETRVNLPILGF